MNGGDFLIGIKTMVEELESLRKETVALRAANRELEEQQVHLEDQARRFEAQKRDFEFKLDYKDLSIKLIKEHQAEKDAEKDEELVEMRAQVKRLEKENNSLGKRERVFKRMAEQRNSQRLVDIKAVEPYKVGDVLIVRIDGQLHYASVQKINSATLTVKRETGGWFRISPSKIEKIFYANDQLDHEEDSSSSSEEEDNEEMEEDRQDEVVDREDEVADREDEDPFSSEPSDPLKRARDQEENQEEESANQKRLREAHVEAEGEDEESFSDSSFSYHSSSSFSN